MAKFEGLMMKSVWSGLQIKRDKNLKSMPLNVPLLDGSSARVVFQDIHEFKYPNEYMMLGTCLIKNEEHEFEYVSPFGQQNSTVIQFYPKQEA